LDGEIIDLASDSLKVASMHLAWERVLKAHILCRASNVVLLLPWSWTLFLWWQTLCIQPGDEGEKEGFLLGMSTFDIALPPAQMKFPQHPFHPSLHPPFAHCSLDSLDVSSHLSLRRTSASWSRIPYLCFLRLDPASVIHTTVQLDRVSFLNIRSKGWLTLTWGPISNDDCRYWIRIEILACVVDRR
jgi:hypothetical protein